MKFSTIERIIAKDLAKLGLAWTPVPGHFVWDEHGVCQRCSPFDDGVFFILNLDYFVQLLGGTEQFKEAMIWLPTWEDCRQILASLDISDSQIALHLDRTDAFQGGRERTALYELIREQLSARQARAIEKCKS